VSSISIIIPCFNAAGTLDATIECLLRQENVELDILVVDDGSTDDSVAIARRFEPKLRVLTGRNQGVSAARNRGISETTGDWIVFLDADDLLLPGTLRLRLLTAATGADVVICDWQEWTEDGTVCGPVCSIDCAAITSIPEVACATHVWATTAAIMYRRPLVERIGGFRDDLPIIQDARFLFDAAYRGARFAHSPHIGAAYRISQRSLSRSDPERFWSDVLTNVIQIEALWRIRGKLSPKEFEALEGIYNQAARGLFAAGSHRYFEAVNCQRRLGGRLPLHSRIAAPLAQVVGLWPAQQILRRMGR
jgi:glycosyltransferase involved in cell wall biosynthesis